MCNISNIVKVLIFSYPLAFTFVLGAKNSCLIEIALKTTYNEMVLITTLTEMVLWSTHIISFD